MSARTGTEQSGVVLVDKPHGWTSHDVVARSRGLIGQRRIGHTGTLDPAATGLLVLCIGRATRLVEYMSAHDKRYDGQIRLGTQTSTDDAEGEVVATGPLPPLTPEIIDGLERRFSGVLQQRPPAFSAVHVKGQRAYTAARRGNPLDLPLRQVVVHDLNLKQLAPDLLEISVRCGPGTYVRSLARDVGETLGCGGHLTQLRRTQVGPARLEQAFTLDELQVLKDNELLARAIQQPDNFLTDMDAVLVSSGHAAKIRHGSEIETATIRGAATARVYGPEGEFLAISSINEGGGIRPVKVLKPHT